MKKMKKWGALVVLGLFIVAFACSLPTTPAEAKWHTKTVKLLPVDSSGVYALPDGACVKTILLNGQPAKYVLVKNGTEVDVWAARRGDLVQAVIYK